MQSIFFCFCNKDRLRSIRIRKNPAEFCAEFGKDADEYSLHLVENVDLPPDSNWFFPDSVMCESCSPREPVFSPREPVFYEKWVMRVPGGEGGYANGVSGNLAC